MSRIRDAEKKKKEGDTTAEAQSTTKEQVLWFYEHYVRHLKRQCELVCRRVCAVEQCTYG